MNSRVCPACGTPLDENARVCLVCGMMDGLEAECENHPAEQARRICVVCGKPVCEDCSVSVEGRSLCDIPDHRRFLLEWTSIFETPFEFEADLIERNLQQAGMDCRVFCLSDHVATFGIDEVRRTRVLVPREQAPDALALLRRLRLISDPDSTKQL